MSQNWSEQMEAWLQREMDSCMSRVFLHEEEEAFTELFNLILYESVNGTNTSLTCLQLTTLYSHQSLNFSVLMLIQTIMFPSVDYRHTKTGSTPLMVAAGGGFITQAEQLLNMGADIKMKAFNGW